MKKFFILFFIFLVTSAHASQEINTISASFRQEKHLPILARPLVSTGKMFFKAPSSLRWQYQTPFASVILAHEGRVKKFIKRDGVYTAEQSPGLDSMQVIIEQMRGWLDGQARSNSFFKVVEDEKEKITLKAKTKELAAIISAIELYPDRRRGTVEKVIIREGEEAWTKISFHGIRINGEINGELFMKP